MTAPAGIRDVAALAGVSPGTVSKALNGTGQLREATRERVRAAARQLAFEPNPVARSLLRGRTCTVGIVTTDHSGRFSIPLMRGAEDALAAGELAALMCDSRGDPVRERDYVRLLLARRVDGIIVAGRRTDPRPRCAPRALPRRCRRAGELLLAAIAGRPCAGVHELPCRLVIRESSAPAGG